jgi:hypothetical protein
MDKLVEINEGGRRLLTRVLLSLSQLKRSHIESYDLPIIELEPGPPLSQSINGAWLGFRLSHEKHADNGIQ